MFWDSTEGIYLTRELKKEGNQDTILDIWLELLSL